MKKVKSEEKKEQDQHKSEGFVVRVFSFFNQYDKIIYGIAIGLLIIVCGLLALNKFYLTPQAEKASQLMRAPMNLLQQSDTVSLMKALEGDEENEGFLSIASSSKLTSTSNTANYFAGLCYMKLGDKEEALHYLLKFKHKDEIYWYAAQGMISDLYDDMGELSKAITYCKKAAETQDPYLAPVNLFKLGQLYERGGDWKKAATAYQAIKDKFYVEYQKMNIDKFLDRALLNQNK